MMKSCFVRVVVGFSLLFPTVIFSSDSKNYNYCRAYLDYSKKSVVVTQVFELKPNERPVSLQNHFLGKLSAKYDKSEFNGALCGNFSGEKYMIQNRDDQIARFRTQKVEVIEFSLYFD